MALRVAPVVVLLSIATGCGAQEPGRPPAAGGRATDAATPATYRAKVHAAQPGDVILLSNGDYGAFELNVRKFADPGLKIEATTAMQAWIAQHQKH
jgi:hypothetical protein